MSARLCAESVIKDCYFASTSVLHPRLLYFYECLACLTECCLAGLPSRLCLSAQLACLPYCASPLPYCLAGVALGLHWLHSLLVSLCLCVTLPFSTGPYFKHCYRGLFD